MDDDLDGRKCKGKGSPLPLLAHNPRRRLPAFFLSLIFHLAIIFAVSLAGLALERGLVRTAAPEIVAGVQVAGGSHPVPIQLPRMDTAAHAPHPKPRVEAATQSRLPTPHVEPPKPSGGGTTAAPHAGNGSGSAAAGNGSDAVNAVPAFPVFSPRPPVTDRALLPSSARKIVVDVNVDAGGQVVGERLVTGMGNQLDSIVLDTVKTWRFQPATIDGKPVATQAELIFPFDLNYPVAMM